MTSTGSDRFINGLCRFLMLATGVCLIIIPMIVVAFALFPDWPALFDPNAAVNGWMSPLVRLGALALVLPGLALKLYGLLGLRQAFAACADRQYFSDQSIHGFRRYALASLLGAIWTVPQSALFMAYLTGLNPHVEGQLAISFGSNEIADIGGALIFFLVAHILAEGRHLQDENEAFL